jgi:hypothetical protein
MVDHHIFGPPRVFVPPPTPPPPPLMPWEKCTARTLLQRDLMDGVVPLSGYVMNASKVQQTRPEYMAYDLDFFNTRLQTMRANMRKQHTNSQQDAISYAHDRLMFPTPTHNPNGILRWEGSEAETLLRTDIEAGVHNAMTPKQMYLSRPKYQMFSQRKFAGHIHQEIRRRKFVQSYFGRR